MFQNNTVKKPDSVDTLVKILAVSDDTSQQQQIIKKLSQIGASGKLDAARKLLLLCGGFLIRSPGIQCSQHPVTAWKTYILAHMRCKLLDESLPEVMFTDLQTTFASQRLDLRASFHAMRVAAKQAQALLCDTAAQLTNITAEVDTLINTLELGTQRHAHDTNIPTLR